MKLRSVRAELFHADGRADRRTDRLGEINISFLGILRTRLKKIFHQDGAFSHRGL